MIAIQNLLEQKLQMETEYNRSYDFVVNTGQGLLCPYYYVLQPIMAAHASTKSIASFESEGLTEFPTATEL